MPSVASQALAESATARQIFNGGAKGSAGIHFGGDTAGPRDCGDHA
ncbi:hypothetical protein [Prevotella sp. S7-1-8]|nr:hypothetical protein [Prevotella sp. S7-1-8]